jgi:cytidylate kinase
LRSAPAPRAPTKALGEPKISQDEALARIEKTDGEREEFIRAAFGRDVTDPTAYDLLVNTGRLSLEQAAETIVAAYRAKFGQKA